MMPMIPHGVPTPANAAVQRLGNRMASEGLGVGHFTLEQVQEMIDRERATDEVRFSRH